MECRLFVGAILSCEPIVVEPSPPLSPRPLFGNMDLTEDKICVQLDQCSGIVYKKLFKYMLLLHVTQVDHHGAFQISQMNPAFA